MSTNFRQKNPSQLSRNMATSTQEHGEAVENIPADLSLITMEEQMINLERLKLETKAELVSLEGMLKCTMDNLRHEQQSHSMMKTELQKLNNSTEFKSLEEMKDFENQNQQNQEKVLMAQAQVEQLKVTYNDVAKDIEELQNLIIKILKASQHPEHQGPSTNMAELQDLPLETQQHSNQPQTGSMSK